MWWLLSAGMKSSIDKSIYDITSASQFPDLRYIRTQYGSQYDSQVGYVPTVAETEVVLKSVPTSTTVGVCNSVSSLPPHCSHFFCMISTISHLTNDATSFSHRTRELLNSFRILIRVSKKDASQIVWTRPAFWQIGGFWENLSFLTRHSVAFKDFVLFSGTLQKTCLLSTPMSTYCAQCACLHHPLIFITLLRQIQ